MLQRKSLRQTRHRDSRLTFRVNKKDFFQASLLSHSGNGFHIEIFRCFRQT